MAIQVITRVDPDSVSRTEEKLNRAIRHSQKLKRPFRRFAEKYIRETKQAFNKRGRKGTWAPYSDFTIALRKASGRPTEPKGMLSDRGILKGSITPKVSDTELRVGTSVPYAAIQQFGGTSTLKLSAVTIKPRHAKALRFTTNTGQTVFAMSVRVPARTIKTKIPARPFLVVLPKDKSDLVGEIDRHMRNNT